MNTSSRRNSKGFVRGNFAFFSLEQSVGMLDNSIFLEVICNQLYGAEGELLATTGSSDAGSYQYDAMYHQTAITDGNGNATHFSYDTTGRQIQITYPGGQKLTNTAFDNSGRVLAQQDGNNVTTSYSYEPTDGQISSITYPEKTISYSYNADGLPTALTDTAGGSTLDAQGYSYDDPGNLLSVVTTYAGLSPQTVSYSYYPNGSRQSMTTPAGVFSYRYDALGRLASLTNAAGKTSSWQYRNDGLLAKQMLGNHAWTNYLYDLRGELMRLTNHAPDGHLLSDYAALTYDGNGNLTGLTATVPGARQLSGTTSYTYDGTGQLTQEQSTRDNNYTRAFSYDAAGNPTHFGSLSGSILQYNSNNQLIDSSYVYDGNGNPTLYNGNHLTFDTANHLTQFADANNNILMTAGYRADGLRAWKETYDRNHNPHRRYFLYDGEQLLCELDITGNVLTATTWGATGLLARGKTWYLFDQQGNVAHRLDDSGKVLSSDLYDAYGNLLAGGDANDPVGFNGRWGYYTDHEIGLVLCTYRYYDATTGRFITRDPIGYNGGINLYRYCLNKPIDYIDSYGLDNEDVLPDKPVPPNWILVLNYRGEI